MSTTTIPTVSPSEIKAGVNAELLRAGLAKSDDDGVVRIDRSAFNQAVAEVMIANAICVKDADPEDMGPAKADLYESVFDDGPSLTDSDPVQVAVAESLRDMVWDAAKTDDQGPVQVKLGQIEGAEDLLLCQRRITGRGNVRYLTRTPELIRKDYVQPVKQRKINTDDKTKAKLDLAMKRCPALEASIKDDLRELAARSLLTLGVSAQEAAAFVLPSGE